MIPDMIIDFDIDKWGSISDMMKNAQYGNKKWESQILSELHKRAIFLIKFYQSIDFKLDIYLHKEDIVLVELPVLLGEFENTCQTVIKRMAQFRISKKKESGKTFFGRPTFSSSFLDALINNKVIYENGENFCWNNFLIKPKNFFAWNSVMGVELWDDLATGCKVLHSNSFNLAVDNIITYLKLISKYRQVQPSKSEDQNSKTKSRKKIKVLVIPTAFCCLKEKDKWCEELEKKLQKNKK